MSPYRPLPPAPTYPLEPYTWWNCLRHWLRGKHDYYELERTPAFVVWRCRRCGQLLGGYTAEAADHVDAYHAFGEFVEPHEALPETARLGHAFVHTLISKLASYKYLPAWPSVSY